MTPSRLFTLVLASSLLLCATSLRAFDYLQTLPEQSLIPADNPQSAEKIALGKKLFFDPQLLGTHSVLSCNSCHNLKEGGDDNQAYSFGQQGKRTGRSSPALWNIGLQTVLYWDGRAASLEQQALDHLRDPLIAQWKTVGALMDHVSRSASYQRDFAAAFPGEPLSAENLARAIASFERSLLTPDSAFDRYLRGDNTALTPVARRGLQAFTDSGCLACHFGVNFAGPAPGPALGMGDGFYELFPNYPGTAYEQHYRLAEDLGRYAWSGDPEERYMWRVPPLRNIEHSAPYFHNGSVATLEEAIRVMGKTQFNKDLPDNVVQDIAAFLKSLSGKF